MIEERRCWTLELVKDPESDDLMLVFPDEVLEALNLKIGDVFSWKADGTGVLLERVGNDFPRQIGENSCAHVQINNEKRER